MRVWVYEEDDLVFIDVGDILNGGSEEVDLSHDDL